MKIGRGNEKVKINKKTFVDNLSFQIVLFCIRTIHCLVSNTIIFDIQ
jgi:hypothetical protein